MVSDDVIDQAALRRLLDMIGGDQEDLNELLDEFFSETPKTLQTMSEAAESADLSALRIASHSLKSNGRDFGAAALADACERLEHACRDGSVDDPIARVKEVSHELQRAITALSSVSL